MGENGDSKRENFSDKCRNIILNFIAEYGEEKKSPENTRERTSELVERYEKKLKSDFEITDKEKLPYDYFPFFYNVLSGCYEYLEGHFKMLETNDENSLLTLKYKNALQTFGTISYVMQLNDFTGSLILFRALYEDMVILKFLLTYPDCIGEFDEYSVIKLTKLFDIYGVKLAEIKKRTENDNIKDKLKRYYGWSQRIIKKDAWDIKFHDIEDEVFKDPKYKSIKENMVKTYNLISDLSHANTSILIRPDNIKILFNLLFDCFAYMGFPLIVDNFLTLFKFVYKGQFSSEVDAFNELFFALFPHIYDNQG
jgi:hypothetical protein